MVIAALPTGANVFLLAQRYHVAEAETPASIAVPTALALATLPVAMFLATQFLAGWEPVNQSTNKSGKKFLLPGVTA